MRSETGNLFHGMEQKNREFIVKKRIDLIILGCGARGNCYSAFAAEHPDRVRVVAVADPRDDQRNMLGDRHGVPEEKRFRSWTDAMKLPKFADAVAVCTQDDMHEGPAVAAAERSYHILLEKPMAPTEAACRRIAESVRKSGVRFAVCHVLRYTQQTRKIRELISSGVIGDIVSIQRLESVGYWHQAHSFVRGNWRNESESSCMLLAKCCHDVDWICHIMNAKCESVSSFGALKHFRPENRPRGAADRCLECPAQIEETCPYSALKIYLRDRLDKGETLWPVNILTHDTTREGVLRALAAGPYGRCVYACDNDVVDHQVVNFQFEGNRTASLTMTAFGECGRKTTIFGTRGSIYADENTLSVFDFLTDRTEVIDLNAPPGTQPASGHGGGDGGIMDAFLTAVSGGDVSGILSGVDETLASHLVVFAAERSRLTNRVMELSD